MIGNGFQEGECRLAQGVSEMREGWKLFFFSIVSHVVPISLNNPRGGGGRETRGWYP
jgi:hypothetical protein